MLTTVSDIQTEFLVRNNRTTTDSFITDAILNGWIRDAHNWASSNKKWPFSEGRASTSFASLVTDETGYLSGEYPEGWKSDAIRLLTIDGKIVKKKNFYKFQQFLEENPADSERMWSDFGRRYYINPGIDIAGTVMCWGQYTPALDPTDKTAVTVFSYNEELGNDAIVEKMTSYLKKREHLPDEVKLADQTAQGRLDEVWKKVTDEQYAYQDTQNDGMFRRINLLNGFYHNDGNNPDRFY